MKRFTSILATAVLVLSSMLTLAQNEHTSEDTLLIPRNTFMVTLAGNGALYSVGYERLIPALKNRFVSLGISGGVNARLPIIFDENPRDVGMHYFVISNHATYNIGDRDFKLDLGVGQTIYTTRNNTGYLFYPVMAFRYLPNRSPGFSARLFGSFFIDNNDKYIPYIFPIGLSLGLAL